MIGPSSSQLALVTGGNRGIGFEIAKQLAGQGVHVIIGARDLDKGREVAKALAGNGRKIDVVALDVASGESITRACAEIEQKHGGLDILVNNAGILIDGPGGFSSSLFDMTDDTARKTWVTNVLGPARLMQAVVPGMTARGFGRVVNLSSRAGQLAEMGMGFPAYRMSKAALNALTKLTAAEVGAEFGNSNVKVNAMCPGWCRTDMGGAGATRSPEDGAKTAVWLAMLPDNGPSGKFFHDNREIPW
jgi:NAD(P)-dependent dehydrogenase (short-subunit alcohol dehydrogenase family)